MPRSQRISTLVGSLRWKTSYVPGLKQDILGVMRVRFAPLLWHLKMVTSLRFLNDASTLRQSFANNIVFNFASDPTGEVPK